MCDGDDIGDAVGDVIEAITESEATTRWLLFTLLCVFGLVVYYVSISDQECGKRQCPHSQPKMVDDKCLCVEPSVPS